MAKGNVVKLTPALIKEFKDKKIIREMEEEIDINLPPIGRNEKYVGTLTPEESAIFVEVLQLKNDMQEYQVHFQLKSLESLVDSVNEFKDKILSVPIPEAMTMLSKGKFTVGNGSHNKHELNEMYEVKHKLDYLENFFWYTVKSRLKNYSAKYSIRQNFAVVE